MRIENIEEIKNFLQRDYVTFNCENCGKEMSCYVKALVRRPELLCTACKNKKTRGTVGSNTIKEKVVKEKVVKEPKVKEKIVEANAAPCINSFTASSAIKEISEYITSLGFEVVNNEEYNIFIPEKKLAINLLSLFDFSEQQLKLRGVKSAKQHTKNMLDIATSNGIRLIQIFEDEYLIKNNLIKGRIKHILGICDTRIFARKCTIKTITTDIKNKFFDAYHIQGKDISASHIYGAFYKDELIAIMTFCKPRVNLGRKSVKEGEYELSRYAIKHGVSAIGLASKLFAHFVKESGAKEIYTYTDLRWNTGKVYEKMGMKYISYSSPSYFYLKDGKRKNRFQYRKNELPKLLEKFDPNKTEYENCLENGLDRVFDCGCFKFIWVNQ